MHPAVRDDRIYFSNPSAVVRFRSAVKGEFQAVINDGGDASTFRPRFADPRHRPAGLPLWI